MGLLDRLADKLVKRYIGEEHDKALEPLIRSPGPLPKAKMAQLSKFIEKYGVEGVLEAVETGLKGQNTGISFKMEITREDIKNDPQFVVNAIQIAQALKALENPELAIQANQPSGIAKKIKEIQDALALSRSGQLTQ